MTTIITITSEEIGIFDNNFYDYSGEDRILKNIISGDYEVLYSGQNQGRLDYQLEDNVNASSMFRVYYRRKRNSPFIFLGSTNCSSIVKERTIAKGINSLPNERLQIRLVIPLANISKTKIYTEFEGIGKYKKAILQHSDFDINANINLGFYTKI
tara:strand:- start:1161 stop:1625 length:465 start_codon:yes stop_codon:yes gene_type:complete